LLSSRRARRRRCASSARSCTICSAAAANPLPSSSNYLLLRHRLPAHAAGVARHPGRVAPAEPRRAGELRARIAEQNPSAALGDYLDSITLISDLDRYESEKGVTLMTLHRREGPRVPHRLSGRHGGGDSAALASRSDANEDLEEERRLCYVGMTRAREQLYCLYSLERRVHGQFREQSPSPFLSEDTGRGEERGAAGALALRAGGAVVARAADTALIRPLPFAPLSVSATLSLERDRERVGRPVVLQRCAGEVRSQRDPRRQHAPGGEGLSSSAARACATSSSATVRS